jgi:hypothetical protein
VNIIIATPKLWPGIRAMIITSKLKIGCPTSVENTFPIKLNILLTILARNNRGQH